MRKIIGFYSGAVCGTDAVEAFVVPATYTDAMIMDHIVDWAYQEHEQWVDQNEEDGIDYGGPDFFFEDYDPNKHDMLRAGGYGWDDVFDRG